MNLEKYKKLGMSPQQLNQIKLGIEAGVDVDLYTDTRFNWFQMEQIRIGLELRLDVTVYNQPNIPADEMEHIREKLLFESGELEIKQEEIKKKRLINFSILIIISISIVIICTIAYLMKDHLAPYFQSFNITLKVSEVDISFGSQFISSDYIESYTDDDGLDLFLPDQLDTNTVGASIVTYKISNGKKTVSKKLIVNIVDHDKPIIDLSENSISLDKSKDTFNCRAYIVSAIDNVDGDLAANVSCDSSLDLSVDQQVIKYEVIDSSNNVGTASLIVNFKKNEAPKPTPAPFKKATTPAPYVPPQDSWSSSGSNEIYYEESWSSSGSYEVDSDVTVDFE